MFYKFALGLMNIVIRLIFRFKVEGRENMPMDEGIVLAVNHRSNWDPVLAGLASPRPLTFMAKEELFKNKFFGGLITSLGAFPLKRGGGDIGAFRAAMKIIGNKGVMLIFPEGHRMKNGVRGKAGAGVALIAQRTRARVVPMCISGGYGWMSKVTVRIGEPLSFDELYGKKLTAEEQRSLAGEIMDKVWELEG